MLQRFRNCQNPYLYQKRKNITWNQVSAFSKDKNVAKRFSNNKGTIFEAFLVSARDISSISVFPDEQEVVLMPFCCFQVKKLLKSDNGPWRVRLREIPLPRTTKIVVWVDDNPEINYDLIQKAELEMPEISIVCCLSTINALSIIKLFRWIFLLDHSQLRVVSDMVRYEDGDENQYAGTELLDYLFEKLKFKNEVLIYTANKSKAYKNCQKRNIEGKYRITNWPYVLNQFIRFN